MQSYKPESKGFKVTLIVLLGLAAFSSAMKDLNHIREFVGDVQEFAGNWSSPDGLLASNQGAISSDEPSCPSESKQLAKTSAGSNQVELEETTELEGIDNDGMEPEVGGKAEVAANRMATLSVARLNDHKPARVLKSIFARSNNVRWPEVVEHRNLTREVTLDLPMIVLTETKADSSNAYRIPEFPLSMLDKINRKQIEVKTHIGKREWLLRRIDGNINVRRSS